MTQRPIVEAVKVKIGGIAVAKYKAYLDELEVILVVRSADSFYPIVLTGRRAHQALKIKKGQWVETTGGVKEHPVVSVTGYKIPFSVSAQSLKIGSGRQDVSDPFADISELSKGRIFQRCYEISNNASM